MNNERFAVPELLFHPSDIGKVTQNVHQPVTCTIGHLKITLALNWTSMFRSI